MVDRRLLRALAEAVERGDVPPKVYNSVLEYQKKFYSRSALLTANLLKQEELYKTLGRRLPTEELNRMLKTYKERIDKLKYLIKGTQATQYLIMEPYMDKIKVNMDKIKVKPKIAARVSIILGLVLTFGGFLSLFRSLGKPSGTAGFTILPSGFSLLYLILSIVILSLLIIGYRKL